MSDETKSSPVTADSDEARPEEELSPAADRRQPFPFGLTFVTLLNLISLAFIAYHFSNHPHGTGSHTASPSTAIERSIAARPALPNGEPAAAEETGGHALKPAAMPGAPLQGNVGLAPAPPLTVEIASHAHPIDMAMADPSDPAPTSEPERPDETSTVAEATTAAAGEETAWVQLGALSSQAMVESYWSTLQRRHESLLGHWKPHQVGPDQVGGSLHHLRIGPMTDAAAVRLCDALHAAGADCFSMAPKGG